jgi:16S rRNA (cytosine1402-N4)-methyltransferase
MRMDRRARVTAATLLNRASEQELADIFYRYGEERRARRVAAAVVARREERPWERTLEFAELVTGIVGRGGSRGLPPATRCFQALRIAVNDELGELERGLKAALSLLRPGGRLAVISFHSLEDRMVKQFYREQAASCVCPPGLPKCVCGKRVSLHILTRKPVTASAEELSRNRRAASAKLRVAEKAAGGEAGETAK